MVVVVVVVPWTRSGKSLGKPIVNGGVGMHAAELDVALPFLIAVFSGGVLVSIHLSRPTTLQTLPRRTANGKVRRRVCLMLACAMNCFLPSLHMVEPVKTLTAQQNHH